MSGKVQKSHRDMYKARTPPWKDTYRKNDENFDFNLDQILDKFDIQAKLRQEEMRMLEEYSNYEQSLLLEEKSLCCAIDKLSAEEVICPMCKKNTLLTNKSVIFCRCGLRINTEEDCLTLSNVKQMLNTGLEQHGEQCDCEPVYSVVSETGITNLLMTCPDCDWMSVVI